MDMMISKRVVSKKTGWLPYYLASATVILAISAPTITGVTLMSVNSLLGTKHTLHYLNFRNTSSYSILNIFHEGKLSPRAVWQVAQNHIFSGRSTS